VSEQKSKYEFNKLSRLYLLEAAKFVAPIIIWLAACLVTGVCPNPANFIICGKNFSVKIFQSIAEIPLLKTPYHRFTVYFITIFLFNKYIFISIINYFKN